MQEKALYFYGYTWIVKGWNSVFGGTSTASSVLLGSMAEWCHLPISLPIDAVTVRIQTGKGGESPIYICECKVLLEFRSNLQLIVIGGIRH
jgi:hypothetical protein